ncbi:hypothetical protein FA13DRAFT_1733273 [Coprinellus micaceus]|uniref:Uncharacterized protein n=1 Tax=Coprinellus micaceus TaxID=71717 RepID=A0A4Y7T9S1_COPMI|nr:hypothetical protein FA13DRAFT_1733273 [Coprinellus micaceus]
MRRNVQRTYGERRQHGRRQQEPKINEPGKTKGLDVFREVLLITPERDHVINRQQQLSSLYERSGSIGWEGVD